MSSQSLWTNIHSKPALFCITISFIDTSSPSNSFASLVHSQAITLAGFSGGECSLGAILLIGFNQAARIDVCISVLTVPGLKPIARIPCVAYS